MNQILMDTSYKTLTVACIINNEVVSMVHKHAFKNQSEFAMQTLFEVVSQANIQPSDIDEFIITVGPGSYTGVRIAMSIAKTLAAVSPIKIKTITSLQLFVSDEKPTLVLFDARSDRAYVGVFNQYQYVVGPMVISVDKVSELIEKYNPIVVGDGNLVDELDNFDLTEDNILMAIKHAVLVEDVDHLKPMYLKEMSAY